MKYSSLTMEVCRSRVRLLYGSQIPVKAGSAKTMGFFFFFFVKPELLLNYETNRLCTKTLICYEEIITFSKDENGSEKPVSCVKFFFCLSTLPFPLFFFHFHYHFSLFLQHAIPDVSSRKKITKNDDSPFNTLTF